MEKEVMFSYGVLSDSLEEQANKQGFTLGSDAEYFENLNKAIITCWLNRLCTESQYDAMINKLQKKVMKALKPLEKEVE